VCAASRQANSIFHSLEIANEVVRPGGELQNKALLAALSI